MPSPMKFVGGLACLDFVNTVGGWVSGGVREDKLETYADLVRWAALARLIGRGEARALLRRAQRHPVEARRVLARASKLRLAIYRLFQHRQTATDLRGLQNELAVARRHRSLALAHRSVAWTWDHPENALDSILWRVSQCAADLLTAPDLQRVRRCGGENCGWLFLDTTRNHSRHWCDMKDCGNLAKVRRFRKRQEPKSHPVIGLRWNES